MARGAAALKVVQEHHHVEDEAQPDAVKEFAEGLNDGFLFCREMGHNWRPWSAGRHEDGGFERILRCNRCKTRRYQQINVYGTILSGRYEYPEGYQSKGLGRIVGDGRGALRLVSIARAIKEEK